MSLENYTVGAKQQANEAALTARPDSDFVPSVPLLKGKIVADNGRTYSIQLLGDDGQPVLDENGDPVVYTRVPAYPSTGNDSCLVWIDNGIPYVLNMADANDGAFFQGYRDAGFWQPYAD